LAFNQAYGKSQGEILANEKELLLARQLANSEKFFATGGFTAADKLKNDLQDATRAYTEFINAQTNAGKDQKLNEADYNAQKDLLQSRLDLLKENYSEQKQVVDDYVNYNNDITAKELQIDRLNADERRKLTLETATITANAQIDANNRGLENDRATLSQRIQLLQSNAEQQKKIAQAQNKSIQNDPGVSKNDKNIARKQLKATETKIEKDGEEAIRKLKEDYRRRDVQAEFTSAKTVIETRMKASDDIKNNENRSLEDRLFAAYDFLQAQETIIQGEANLQLQTAGLTATERKAIEDEANAKILESRVQFSKDINAITLQDLEKQGENRLSIADKENSEAILKLNEQLSTGLITYKQYHEERLKLENQFGALSLAIQIENIQKVIEEYKKQGKDTTQLETDIANKQKEISDGLTQHLIENLERVRERQIEMAGELTDLFVTLDAESGEREKEKIDAQIEEIEKRKERETAFVEQTIQNEQAKAEALTVIDQKAQRDKQVLADRQKKIDADKARTDKLVAVGKIAGDTAQAVFRLSADAAAAKAQGALLASNPATAVWAPIAYAAAASIATQIPLVIGLGAVQAAKVLAVKAFRYGGTTTEDGTVLVGDGFQSEFGVTKDGRVIKTPPVPTLMNMEADTTIYPNQKSLEAAILQDVHSGPVLTDTGTHFRYMTEKLGGKIDNVGKIIKRKKETHINLPKQGWEIMTRSGGNTYEYLNRNLK
jgi:DNA-binding Lrp family transcriptional regulator